MSKQKKTVKHKKIVNPRLFRKFVKAALVLAVLGGLTALSLTVLFPVKQCTVTAGRYTAQQYANAMGLAGEKMNLFTANKAALARKAHAALPWAHIVKISRRLPGTLHLTVEERAAAFAQEQDKSWWVLTQDGILLGTQDTMPEGLMPITGAPLQGPKPGHRAKWRNAFTTPGDIDVLLACLRESSLWPHITALRISTAAVPDAVYQDRIRIRFGTAVPTAAKNQETNLREKLRIAEEAIAIRDEQNPGQRGILDLSTHGKAYFTADW